MDIFEKSDNSGCTYIMSIIESLSSNTITQWEHTPQYCHYDMNWTAGTKVYAVEAKNRKNWIDDYSTVMFEVDKYDKLMNRYSVTGEIPIYAAGYYDGVIVYDLRKLDKDCVHHQLTGNTMVAKTTVYGGDKQRFTKLFLPKPDKNNKLGKIIRL